MSERLGDQRSTLENGRRFLIATGTFKTEYDERHMGYVYARQRAFNVSTNENLEFSVSYV